MILRRARLLLLVLVVFLAGCASGRPSWDARDGHLPRARCLTDPARDATEGTRPLFLFFCVESP